MRRVNLSSHLARIKIENYSVHPQPTQRSCTLLRMLASFAKDPTTLWRLTDISTETATDMLQMRTTATLQKKVRHCLLDRLNSLPVFEKSNFL